MSAGPLVRREGTTAGARSSALPPSRLAALLLLAIVSGCRGEPTAPAGPPYLAIVTDMHVLPGVVAPGSIRYHVTELSGTLGIDRSFEVAPSDTVIVNVPPATYVIDLQDIPPTCFVREGAQRAIVLTKEDNTGLVRFSVQCRGALNVETATDGHDADDAFVYRLSRGDGMQTAGLVGANDTLVFDALPPGEYAIRLGGVEPNCVVTSEGGAEQRFVLDEAGGTTIRFRIQCARESERPHILSLESSYVLGSSVFTIVVYDPNRDVDGYVWDLTDCRGHDILPDGKSRMRRGLLNGRTRAQDTLRIVGAFDVGLPSDQMQGRCTRLRVFDYESNSTEIVERRIGASGGGAPVVTAFNSVLVGTQYVQTTLSATDPDGDLAGVFVAVRLRDGTLAPADGFPDIGTMDPAGYLTTAIPPIPTTGRIGWDDVYAVIIWVIDARGNAVRFEDSNVFE